MIHWTDIEQSKDGILQILEVIKNYEKDGEVRFIEGIQRCHFSENKIQQLICIVRERLNMTRRELLRLSEIAPTFNKMWATDDNNCFRDADKLFRKIRSTLKGTKIIYKRFTPICRKNVKDKDFRPSVFVKSTMPTCSSCLAASSARRPHAPSWTSISPPTSRVDATSAASTKYP